MEIFKEELIHNNLPFPVDIFIRDNLVENISADPHWHDCFEILYMLEGYAEQQINNRHFKACRNDLLILSRGDIHSTYCKQGVDTRILVIKFLPDILTGSFPRLFESKYILAFLNYKSENVYSLADTSKNSKELYNLVMGLYKEFTDKEAGYEIYIKGYIYQLIAFLVRICVINANITADKENEIAGFDVLLKYIENNYKEKIDLKKAANMLNLSYSYFSRRFKRITGRTFKEYVDFVRVCEVEKLILSTALNISQAAFEAGFNNISSFNRVFKRVKGCPPGNIKRSKTAKD